MKRENGNVENGSQSEEINDFTQELINEIEVKQRKVSTSGTLNSMVTLIKNLTEGKLANEEELKELKQMYNKLYERWMGKKFDI